MFLQEYPQLDTNKRSDEEILALSLVSPRYFEVLVERYEEPLLRKARVVLRNPEEAEDVVQETFTKVYLSGHRFKEMEGASFKSWIYKILMNTSFTKYQNLKKERGRRAEIDEEIYAMLPDKEGSSFEEKLSARDEVIRVLIELPEHFSKLLNSYYLEGKSQKEIAKEEGDSIGAIKTRMHRAKKAFREVSDKLSVLA